MPSPRSSTIVLSALISMWLALDERAIAGPRATQRPAEPVPQQGSEAQLPDVTITANPMLVPPVALDEPRSRNVLQPDEVKKLVFKDLNELVQHVPSISTRPYNGADAVSPNFAIRGLPDDGLTEYILVTIDGVPANPMPYGWTAMSFLPLFAEQVRAIELIQGGTAVRYSPITVGGVLDFVTQPIPKDQLITLFSTAGSNCYRANLVSIGDTNGKVGWLITVGDRHGDGYRDHGEFDQQTIDGKFQWARADGSWTSMRMTHFDSFGRRPGGLTLAEYDEDRFQNVRPTNYHEGQTDTISFVDHVQHGSTSWSETYAWASSTYNRISGPTPFINPTLNRRNTYTQYNANVGWRAEHDVDLFTGDDRLHYGVRVSYEWLPSRRLKDTPIGGGPSTVSLNTESEVVALSAHVDDTFRPTEDLGVTLGVRAEWVPTTQTEDNVTGGDVEDQFFDVLPAAGLSYQLTDDAAVFANYQRSFRAPQVWGFNGNAVDEPDLDFEHGQQAELGVRVGVGGGTTLSVAGWRTEFDDVAISVGGIYENLGGVLAHGVDAGVHWRGADVSESLAGFELRVDGTLQDSELEDAAALANDGNETPFAWEHKLAWLGSYEWQSGWQLAVSGTYIGDSFADDANTETPNANGTVGLNPSRTLWDFQVARTFELEKGGLARLFAGVHNAFDDEWWLYSRIGGKSAGAPRELSFGLSLSF